MNQIGGGVYYQKLQSIIDLCETISEAARYIGKGGNLQQEVKSSLLDGLEAVYNQLTAFDGSEKLLSAERHRQLVNTICSSSDQEIEKKVNQWRCDVVMSMVYLFSDATQKEFELPADVVESGISIIDNGFADVSLEVKSQLRMVLAMSCTSTVPLTSFRLMRQAFIDTPTLTQLLFSNMQHLKTYTYAPKEHRQVQFDKCPICGGSGSPYHAAASCLMGDFSAMALPFKLWLKCENCENLYTKYFPEEYFSRAEKPHIIFPQGNFQTADKIDYNLLQNWSQILNKVSRYTAEKNLLEVGIGKGYLIAVALEMGYDVSGVEISEGGAQNVANQLSTPIICGDFLDIEEDKKYAVITMGDVLEHLKDPTAGLRKAHRLLKDDGVLWLSTPNYLSAYARMTRNKNPMWNEPNHVTYFSRDGLYRILHEVGFEVAEYEVSKRYLGSMELILRKSEPNCCNTC